MPLLEIIKGEETSDTTLHRSLDLARQIRKTPIVVNDSRGFTSRVIGTFINEGIAFLAEGVPASTIEQLRARPATGPGAPAERRAQHGADDQDPQGDPRGPGAEGVEWNHPAFAVVDRMVEAGQAGKLAGAGFYDYEDGKRTGLWAGLREEFPPAGDPADRPARTSGADAFR